MQPLAFIGPTELWIILGILLVLFGATKLPALARSMGSSVTQFKKGLSEDPELLEKPKESDENES